MASSASPTQDPVQLVGVKSEQFAPKSTAMASKKREYQLIFRPTQVSDKDKLSLLNGLLDEENENTQRVEYLSTRVEIFYNKRQWSDALQDIAEIEASNGGKLNELLNTLKIEANIYHDLDKLRQLVTNAIANGTEKEKQFDSFLRLINEHTVTDILDRKDEQRYTKKFKRYM